MPAAKEPVAAPAIPLATAKPAAASPAQVARCRSLLADGRKKVRAKEYAAGIALYEKALALRPGDPRLLVELGWAAFLAGDLERAETATRQGLAGTRDAKAAGAALYNLGRVAEQRGDEAEAARVYKESLAVRPNAVVEKRLAALGADAAVAADGAGSDSELGPLAGPLPSLKATCDALAARARAEIEGTPAGCDAAAAKILEIGEGPLRRALLVPVWRNYFGDSIENAAEVMWHLVVETDAGFFRTDGWVAYVYNPGAFGIYEELEADLALDDLVPGAPREIVVEAKHLRHDSDLGILEEESAETEWLLVCGLVDGAPRCHARIPLRYAFERSVMDMEGLDGEPVEHTPGLPIRESYRFDVKFDGKGGYTATEIAPPVGDAAARVGAHAGTFSLK